MSFSVFKSSDPGKVKAIVEVEDTGFGMDQKTKKGLFKVFESVKQKATNSNFEDDRSENGKRRTQGFGLGLYLSRELA